MNYYKHRFSEIRLKDVYNKEKKVQKIKKSYITADKKAEYAVSFCIEAFCEKVVHDGFKHAPFRKGNTESHQVSVYDA